MLLEIGPIVALVVYLHYAHAIGMERLATVVDRKGARRHGRALLALDQRGGETYAAFRSVVSTARANGASVLVTVRCVLAAKLPVHPILRMG